MWPQEQHLTTLVLISSRVILPPLPSPSTASPDHVFTLRWRKVFKEVSLGPCVPRKYTEKMTQLNDIDCLLESLP